MSTVSENVHVHVEVCNDTGVCERARAHVRAVHAFVLPRVCLCVCLCVYMCVYVGGSGTC